MSTTVGTFGLRMPKMPKVPKMPKIVGRAFSTNDLISNRQ